MDVTHKRDIEEVVCHLMNTAAIAEALTDKYLCWNRETVKAEAETITFGDRPIIYKVLTFYGVVCSLADVIWERVTCAKEWLDEIVIENMHEGKGGE